MLIKIFGGLHQKIAIQNRHSNRIKTITFFVQNPPRSILNPFRFQGELTCGKKERPWYELSDEESDILLPDRLTSKGVPRSSSSEDEAEIC